MKFFISVFLYGFVFLSVLASQTSDCKKAFLLSQKKDKALPSLKINLRALAKNKALALSNQDKRDPLFQDKNPSLLPQTNVRSQDKKPNLLPQTNVKSKNKKPVKIITALELKKYITQGGLLSRGQEMEFQFYLNSSFKKVPVNKTLKDVLDITEQYPEILKKLPVREQDITFIFQDLPAGLTQLVKAYRSTAHRARQIFNISANWGVWAKMFDFKTEALNTPQRRESFFEFLNSDIFGQSIKQFIVTQGLSFDAPSLQTVKDFIENPSNPYKQKTIVLYKVLNEYRKQFIKQKQTDITENLSLAMAELIHSASFGDRLLTDQLKSKNPNTVLQTLKQILSQRDIFAKQLGFNKGYLELESFLLYPFNSSKVKSIRKELAGAKIQIEEILKDRPFKPNTGAFTKTFTLRPLNLQESPFRGCFGQDCSTEGYFKTAFNPAYLYFTLTDRDFVSYGHITVVLGTAKDNKGQTVKTAFVDKIQAIPMDLILGMLEGLRQSLKEQGYRLALPKDVGDGNEGLSNQNLTRVFIETKILPLLNNQLKAFKVEDTALLFNPGYSRAGLFLDLLEFKISPALSNYFKIDPKQMYQAKKQDKILKLDWNIYNLYNNKEDLLAFRIATENLPAVQDLLKNKVDPNFVDPNKDLNFLAMAINTGNKNIVAELIHWGADLNTKSDFFFNTPLIQAIKKRHTDIAIYLINKGANLNTKDDFFKHTPLIWAIKRREIDIAHYLLDKGADESIKNQHGLTAINYTKPFLSIKDFKIWMRLLAQKNKSRL